MSSVEQASRVRKYIAQLKDEAKISHALGRLDKIDMNVSLLTETGVGKEVNRLRNHPQVGQRAQKIVEKWRRLANEQAEPAASSSGSSSSAAVKRAAENGEEITNDCAISFADALKTTSGAPASKKPKLAPKEAVPNLNAFDSYLAAASSGSKPLETDCSMQDMIGARRGKPQKIYAGRAKAKTVKSVEPLQHLALTVCMQNIDLFTHGPIQTAFHIFAPVLDRCTPEQLEKIEHHNPWLEEDTDIMWKKICLKAFPKAEKEKDYDEMWKETYKRLLYEREQRLKQISKKIKRDIKSEQTNCTKHSELITPDNIRRRQINNGTVVSGYKMPNALELSKARQQIYRNGDKSGVAAMPQPLRTGGGFSGGRMTARSGAAGAAAPSAPKRGALMQKTLKMMKNRMRR